MIEADYAHALIHATERGISHEEAVNKFVTILKRKGHLKLLPRIVRELGRIQIRHDRVHGARVRLARAEDKEQLREIINKKLAELNVNEEPQMVEDDTVIGGYVIETGSKMVDGSYKSALMKLYRSVIS